MNVIKKIKKEYSNPFFIPTCLSWGLFILVIILFLSACIDIHRTPDGRRYELKERCIYGSYNGEGGIDCDSNVIDTFWIRDTKFMFK